MSMVRWEPFRDIMAFRDMMDRMFETPFTRMGRPTTLTLTALYMPCDMWETPNDLYVRCAVAGAWPDDVNITVTGETLTISGSVPGPEEAMSEVQGQGMGQQQQSQQSQQGQQAQQGQRNITWYLQEIPSGNFNRTFSLPTMVNADQAQAHFENGILTLRLPKTPEVRPKQIPIRTAQGQQGSPQIRSS